MASDNSQEIQVLHDQVLHLTEQVRLLREVSDPATAGEAAATVDAVTRLIEHPLAAAIIGSFALLVLAPFAKAWLHKNFNGFGKDEKGNQVSFSDVQKAQIRVLKENRNILYKIARRMGVKEGDL